MSGAGGILGLWLASAGVRALIRAYLNGETESVDIQMARQAGKLHGHVALSIYPD
jgi:hypothetical protein